MSMFAEIVLGEEVARLRTELAHCQHDRDTMANKVDQANAALAEREAELARMDVSLARARRAWQESEEAAKLWQRIALAARESILEQEPQP